MAIICRPAVAVPENVISMEETLDMVKRIHEGSPNLPLALRLITNAGVQKRHIIQPLEKTLSHPGFEIRNKIYEREAKRRVPPVVQQALANAELTARDIDAIIYVSCTGFMMPSMTAWLINTMGFRPTPGRSPSHSSAARLAPPRSTARRTFVSPTRRPTSSSSRASSARCAISPPTATWAHCSPTACSATPLLPQWYAVRAAMVCAWSATRPT